jgi:hypothetical protein
LKIWPNTKIFGTFSNSTNLGVPLVYGNPSRYDLWTRRSDLIAEIYPDIGRGRDWADEFFLEWAILCPKNSEVDEINANLLSSFPGQSSVFHSVNTAEGDIEKV